jgi:prolyl 4-hydroxylase
MYPELKIRFGGAVPTKPIESGPRLPEPLRAPGQRLIDAGDRMVSVLAQMRRPRLVLLGNLMSEEECDALIAQSWPKLAQSTVVNPESGAPENHPERTSEGTYFHLEENPLVATIDRRIARVLRWPVENGEGLQILRYRQGGEYRPHFDYFDPALSEVTNSGGNRVGTLIIYLQPCDEGGWTEFPDVGVRIAPQKGSALFFSYERPSPDTLTRHAGLPVISGEKWIATRWLRERPYR